MIPAVLSLLVASAGVTVRVADEDISANCPGCGEPVPPTVVVSGEVDYAAYRCRCGVRWLQPENPP